MIDGRPEVDGELGLPHVAGGVDGKEHEPVLTRFQFHLDLPMALVVDAGNAIAENDLGAGFGHPGHDDVGVTEFCALIGLDDRDSGRRVIRRIGGHVAEAIRHSRRHRGGGSPCRPAGTRVGIGGRECDARSHRRRVGRLRTLGGEVEGRSRRVRRGWGAADRRHRCSPYRDGGERHGERPDPSIHPHRPSSTTRCGAHLPRLSLVAGTGPVYFRPKNGHRIVTAAVASGLARQSVRRLH